MLMRPDLAQRGAARFCPGVQAELWAQKVLGKQMGYHLCFYMMRLEHMMLPSALPALYLHFA